MRIAITGGIAEGKSTVLNYVRMAGYETQSSDSIAHQVFCSDPVQSHLASSLGLSRPISREAVRSLISADVKARKALNDLMHPLIWEAIAHSSSTFIEVPLLVEAALYLKFERVWVVTCGPIQQQQRMIQRIRSKGDLSLDAAELETQRLLALQLPTCVKCFFADRIIRTNGSESDVQKYVLEAIKNDCN